MNELSHYSKMIFLGGGVLAERLYNQIENIETKLIGVTDLCEVSERKIKEFKGYQICSLDNFKNDILEGKTAVVVAIGCWDVFELVKLAIERWGYIKDSLFVVNPYSSLRFFCVDDELAKEARIDTSDERYQRTAELLKDKISRKHFELCMNAKPYEGLEDIYELVSYKSISDMYFAKEDYWVDFFENQKKEQWATVLDCGAFIGDSVEAICNSIPETLISYYAFEPMHENFLKLRQQDFLMCQDFYAIECGIGDVNAQKKFFLPANGDPEGGRFGDCNNECNVMEMRTIDGLDIEVKGRLYIKMDIEGSELCALHGAERTIKKHRPCMAICVYHRKNDLAKIPTYIDDIVDDYNYYLRGGFHTILFAIPKECDKTI